MMALNSKKKIIVVLVVLVIIAGGYFVYSYFSESNEIIGMGNDDIYAKNNNKLAKNQPANSVTIPVMTREESLARFEQLSNVSNLSELKGKDIYDLILILEQIKLNLDLFNNEKFKNLENFSKEITYMEYEKGNISPFRAIESRRSDNRVSTTTPGI